ncbi:hypothetical protein L2E82_32558 [Cichorium intybus]|uniref:Uncharacterized protein n=1 Tax=Cichorium intybus TaxID=13427 RepID=A0ACB9BHI6_CICIN|nr:hypothetical protein L2E82_32558 [Cichorium intybus]
MPCSISLFFRMKDMQISEFNDFEMNQLDLLGIFVIVMEMNDLFDGNDLLMNSEDGFEDNEEAAYTEAVMERDLGKNR